MSNLNQNLMKIIDDLDFDQALKRVKYDARAFPVDGAPTSWLQT